MLKDIWLLLIYDWIKKYDIWAYSWHHFVPVWKQAQYSVNS